MKGAGGYGARIMYCHLPVFGKHFVNRCSGFLRWHSDEDVDVAGCQLRLNMHPHQRQQHRFQQQQTIGARNPSHSSLKGVFNCVNLTPFMAHQPTFRISDFTLFFTSSMLHVGHINYWRKAGGFHWHLQLFNPLDLAQSAE